MDWSYLVPGSIGGHKDNKHLAFDFKRVRNNGLTFLTKRYLLSQQVDRPLWQCNLARFAESAILQCGWRGVRDHWWFDCMELRFVHCLDRLWLNSPSNWSWHWGPCPGDWRPSTITTGEEQWPKICKFVSEIWTPAWRAATTTFFQGSSRSKYQLAAASKNREIMSHTLMRLDKRRAHL